MPFARPLFQTRPLFQPRPFFQTLLLPVLAACLSCGDSLDVPDPDENRTGTLEISVVTTGAELDGNGYLVQVDTETPSRVASEATIRRTLSTATHRVELSDLSAACTVNGDNPRNVTVAEHETATVGFEITCTAAPQGSIQVTITTSGDDPDADGYQVTLDNGEVRVIGANDAYEFPGLTAGVHVVELSGLAPNCRGRDSSR